MSLKKFENVGAQTMKGAVAGNELQLKPGESYTFDTVCQLVKFVNQNPGAAIFETAPGETVDKINKAAEAEGCDERIGASVVVEVMVGVPPSEAPAGGDGPDAQGAPNVKPGGIVDIQFGPYGEPGDPRQPTEAMHDGRNPSSEGEIYDGERGQGATPDGAGQAVDRARKGEPPPGESRGTHSGEKTTARSQGGDPVDLFSGLFVLSAIDLEVPTPFIPIALHRTYRSGRPYFGPWGFNWDHNWNVYLRELSSGNVARWNGRLHEDEFRWTGVAFEPPRGVFERLTRLSGIEEGYTIEAPRGISLLFQRPTGWTDAERIPLVRISDRFANTVSLAYGSENELVSVLDDDGRGLHFHYGQCGRLEAVADHAGRRVEYMHDDEAEHLTGVGLPATPDFPDGVVTYYEVHVRPPHIALRHNVLRVLDHNGNVLIQNVYGEDPSQISFNRVVTQLQGEHLYELSYRAIQYVPSDPAFVNTPAWQTSTKYPDGSLWTHTFNYRADLLDERCRLNLDGSYRVVVSTREYDEQGNLTRFVHPDGSIDEYTFDDENTDPRMRGNLLKVERRASAKFPVQSRVVFQADYDPLFQLPRHIVNEKGALTTVVYDFDVAPDPSNRGVLARIEWPSATLPDGSTQIAQTEIEVNARGQTTAITSPEGARDELDYEPPGTVKAGFLIERRDDALAACEKTIFEHDAYGFPTKLTAPGGTITRAHYDEQGRVTVVELPEVNGIIDQLSYVYDARGAVLRCLYPRGAYEDGVLSENAIADTFTNNPLGHALEAVVGANTAHPRRVRFSPDFQGRPVVTVDPLGMVTRRGYDERGLVLFETIAEGTPEEATTRYIYDLAGRLCTLIAPGGRETVVEYDPWGRVASVTAPNGTTVKTTWGALDLPLADEVIGSPGDDSPPRVLRRLTYEHDERGRLIRRSLHSFTDDPTNATLIAEERWHDRDNRCVKRKGPLGAVSSYEYDGRGRLWREVDPLGNEITMTFGADGLAQTATSIQKGSMGELTLVTTYQHDARGRLVYVLNSSGAAVHIMYDGRDLPVEHTSDSGVLTKRTFGLLGELVTEVIDPGGLAIAHEHHHDLLGRPILYRDPTKEETSIGRDALGRVKSVTLADGATYRWFYDAIGEIVSAESADGSRCDYARDVGSGLVTVTATPGPGRLPVGVHTFTEDGLGRIVRAQVGAEVALRRFDSLDRLVEESYAGRTFLKKYDDVEGCYTLRFPDGREERHSWDVFGRVHEVKLVKVGSSALGVVSGAPDTVLLKLEHLGADRVAKIAFANGTASEWIHDSAGRLLRVEHVDANSVSLDSARCRYDVANRVCVLQRTGAPVENHAFTFDARDRLTQWRTGFALPPLGDSALQAQQDADIAAAQGASSTATYAEEYTLDEADTRTVTTTVKAGVASSVATTQLPGHRVVQVGSTSIAHDGDGRRIKDAARVMTFDALGRLVKIDAVGGGGTLAMHVYDPFGRWAGGELAGAAFSRFSMGELCLQEEDGGGAVTCQRTHVPTLLLSSMETRSSGPLALHIDGHENLVLVTDSAGAPAERYRYSAFGSPRIFDGAGAAELSASPLGLRPCFGGMPYLAGAGLYFTPARHYDPATGLFLARDPFLHAASASPYVFASHDPINRLDPDGNIAPLLAAGLVVGAIGAVVGMGSVIIRGGDYDFADVVAAGAIGFAGGFLGGITFGGVSTWVTGALLGAVEGTSLAGSAAVGVGISVGSGMAGGAVSGMVSGGVSGAAVGVYGGIRSGGDVGTMALAGAMENGVSGMAAGAVAGGLFGGLLRAGTIPSRGWTALQGASAVTPRSAILPWVVGRGMISPYGPVGAAGIGFAAGYAGGVTRGLWRGNGLSDSMRGAVGEGLTGAAASVVASSLHPTTWEYWRIRSSVAAAERVQALRITGVHHQRNVAQYPEFANPQPNEHNPLGWITRLNNAISRGNVSGPRSEFGSEGSGTHRSWHTRWQFGQAGRSWSNISTHGPWTPAWNVNSPPVDPRATNHAEKPQ